MCTPIVNSQWQAQQVQGESKEILSDHATESHELSQETGALAVELKGLDAVVGVGNSAVGSAGHGEREGACCCYVCWQVGR